MAVRVGLACYATTLQFWYQAVTHLDDVAPVKVGVEELRTLRTHAHVARYWRIVHMYSKETPVQTGTVTAHAKGDPLIQVRMRVMGRYELKLLRNTRCLPLTAGTKVYVHGGTIAEIAPWAPQINADK